MKIAENRKLKNNKSAIKKIVLIHCKYCGKLTEGTYCKKCKRFGFNYLNSIYGITNGWDKPVQRKAKITVEDGWRGQKNFYNRSSDN